MPLSDHRQITPIIDAALRGAPRNLLDVGCGHGAYGTLLRQYLGLSALLVGIEPWEPYSAGGSRWWAYDAVLTTPWPDSAPAARRYLRQQRANGTERYDVTLAVDVVEHVHEDDRFEFLHSLAQLSHVLIVATPNDPARWPQVEMPNPLERHYGHCPPGQLPGRCVELLRLPDSYVAVQEIQ